MHFLGLGPAGFHRLHACDWGPADAERVLVCAHGYSGNARDFDILAQALSPTHRVVCPDIAGRGDSGWLATSLEYNFPQFLSDLNALLARLGPREVDWVGTSMGGLLGMLLAAQPNTPIRRLVMNDVGAFLPMPALQYIGQNLVAPESFASLEEVERHLRRTRREWGEIPAEQWRAMARHHARATDDGFRLHYDPTIARVVQPLPFTPGLFFWDAWQAVSCPVLLLRGEHSTVFPGLVADAMRMRRPEARVVEVEGCGHAPSLMVPSQVELVREFLAAPVARPASRLNSRHERRDPAAAAAGAAH